MFVSAGSRAGRNRRIVTANNLTDGAGHKSGWDFEIASPGIARNLYGAATSTNPYGNDLRFSFMTAGTGQGSGVSSQNGVFVFPGNNGYRMYMTGLGGGNNTIGWGATNPSKANWLNFGFPSTNLSGDLGTGVSLYNASGFLNVNNDTYLYRDGAAQAWAIRKGDTTAGSLRIYGVSTNLSTNWNRLNISMSNSTGGATIATESDGSTATAGPLAINASALNMTVSVPASSGFANAGSWFHNGLNTGDTAYWTYGVANSANNSIGIGFFKGASTAANYSYFGMFSGPSFYFHANGLVGFNGVTSSFPAFKRVTTGIQVRLADDSADASISAGLFLLGAVADTGMARNAAGVIEINNGTAGTRRDLYARNVRTEATTVASLVAAATAGAGARSFVTDATATTFMTTVAGGGSNKVPVVSDGTNWLIG